MDCEKMKFIDGLKLVDSVLTRCGYLFLSVNLVAPRLILDL